jgi:hypothetical protein
MESVWALEEDNDMSDSKTENMRLWFEFDEETGRVHMDSLNPKTGGQIPLNRSLICGRLMTRLFIESHEMQKEFKDIPADQQAWSKALSDNMKLAMEAVFKKSESDMPTLTNTGIRTGWGDE